MLYNISPERVLAAYKEMNLPEPFVWPHWENGELAGLVTGHVKDDSSEKFLQVDHMIVLPSAKRKFHTMMSMSEGATQAAFADGCGYVIINILRYDPRSSGLEAWAKRCSYQHYASSDDSEWYIRRRPTERHPAHGQEFTSEAEAAPSPA